MGEGGFAEIVEGRKMALAFGVVGIYFWGGEVLAGAGRGARSN